MNAKSAKLGVLFHMLFTLASLLLSFLLYFTTGGKGTVATIVVPLWMAFCLYSLIKSLSDYLGAQQRQTNFTKMLDKWEQEKGSRSGALTQLTLITIGTGVVKLAIPLILLAIPM